MNAVSRVRLLLLSRTKASGLFLLMVVVIMSRGLVMLRVDALMLTVIFDVCVRRVKLVSSLLE